MSWTVRGSFPDRTKRRFSSPCCADRRCGPHSLSSVLGSLLHAPAALPCIKLLLAPSCFCTCVSSEAFLVHLNVVWQSGLTGRCELCRSTGYRVSRLVCPRARWPCRTESLHLPGHPVTATVLRGTIKKHPVFTV